MLYRKRPVCVQAVRWDGANFDQVAALAGDAKSIVELLAGSLCIRTLEGLMRADVGDWVIQGIHGELYPCKADIFEATYEPADAEHTASL